MSTPDPIARALAGEGPLFDAMLDQRARELATADTPRRRDDGDTLAVLVMAGTGNARWALPLADVARVEEMPPVLPVPGLSAGMLGLAMIAGRRCLLADLDVLAAGVPGRTGARGGHAVLLRRAGLALAVDWAEDIRIVPRPPPGTGLLADGTVLLDAERLAAKANPKGDGE